MRLACIADNEIAYNRRVVQGVAHYVQCGDGLELDILNPFNTDEDRLRSLQQYDGLILATWTDHSEQIRALGIPAVSLSNDRPDLTIPRIVSDDRAIGRLGAEHLLARGHHNFAFIGGSEQYARQRREGFEQYIHQACGEQTTVVHPASQTTDLASHLRQLPQPLGVMAVNDAWGAQVTVACRNAGLLVPEEVAVIGVDDDDLRGGEMANPPLSTVPQLTERIGHTGCAVLLRAVHGQFIPPVTLIPPGPPIIRQSSQAIAIDDALVVEAIRMMERNLVGRITIEDVLVALNVSRRTLELRFRRVLGRTPGQELFRMKIERARYLLGSTRQPMSQVARLAGFIDSVRLSKAFRRATGQTPSAYRKHLAIPESADTPG